MPDIAAAGVADAALVPPRRVGARSANRRAAGEKRDRRGRAAVVSELADSRRRGDAVEGNGEAGAAEDAIQR
jgi:hypothetical protein